MKSVKFLGWEKKYTIILTKSKKSDIIKGQARKNLMPHSLPAGITQRKECTDYAVQES